MSEKKEKALEGLSPQEYAEYKSNRRKKALLATALGVGALGVGAYTGLRVAPHAADKIKEYKVKREAERARKEQEKNIKDAQERIAAEAAKPPLEKSIDSMKSRVSQLKQNYLDPIAKQFRKHGETDNNGRK